MEDKRNKNVRITNMISRMITLRPSFVVLTYLAEVGKDQ